MPSTSTREKIVRSARRLVVKIGTNALTDAKGRLSTPVVAALCGQVVRLLEAKRQVVIVSSGAVGAGVGVLALHASLNHPELAAAMGEEGARRIEEYDLFMEPGILERLGVEVARPGDLWANELRKRES